MIKSSIIKRITKAKLKAERYNIQGDFIHAVADDREKGNRQIRKLAKLFLDLKVTIMTNAGGYQYIILGGTIDMGEYCDKASAYHY